MAPTRPNFWHRILIRAILAAFAVAAVVAGGVVLATVPPTAATFYPRCQLHQLTGLHCPGCGTTRAAHAFLNGNVTQAFAYNALAFVLVPAVGLVLVRCGWRWAWHADDPDTPLFPRWWWHGAALVVLTVAFAVARNVPAYPFTRLAPHELGR
ncbi:MAG: DUF2752 domain-containing protein [Fimbriiglobus sp.]